ncbi:MAG TPA: hypothetical protein VKI18_06845 [Albitalea sp.]|nr:hypothetical protein [Albitalea sp.]
MLALGGAADVEIGLLYARGAPGKRFPGRPWLREAMTLLEGRAALHVCGEQARRELMDGQLHDLTRLAARVQVNGDPSLDEAAAIAPAVRSLITQHQDANAALLGLAAGNHSLLVDRSGGRGVLPSRWERPATAKPVGFAGGLALHNLALQLRLIATVARGDWWIDLEQHLRKDDWFDVTLAAAAVDLFRDILATPFVLRQRHRYDPPA